VARRGRHRRGGRTTPRATRPLGESPWPLTPVSEVEDEEPDLLDMIASLVASGEPVDLLSEVSGIVAAVDPRLVSPMERAGGRELDISLDVLIDSFRELDCPETSALLAVVAHLGLDEPARRRAARIVASRRDHLPTWLASLGDSVAYRAVELVHVLGDGENVTVAVRLPTGHELSVVLYIDHNVGTAAKDGYILPITVDELTALIKEHDEFPGETEWRDLQLADARARMEGAIARGAAFFPPFETASWPMSRPLVEWALRLLPEGGVGYTRPEWSEEDRQSLAASFFASRFGRDLKGEDYRGLLDSFLWFGCDYGPGDPLRWSPVSVEILLTDWLPRKVLADVEFLSKAPRLLREFVRYAHDTRGISARLTEETLAAVDEREVEYQRRIRSEPPPGPHRLLAAAGALDSGPPWDLDEDEPIDPAVIAEIILDSLQRTVGGVEALWQLDTEPLPDEDFRWEGIPDDVRPAVGEILALCDRCSRELFDVEFRTASRRFLAMAARGDPRVFRRRARAEKAAAAVCWIIGKANELFRIYGSGILVKDLAAFFGIANSGASQRANALLKAAGISVSHDYGTWELALGTPDMLVSKRRSDLVDMRERYLREVDELEP
jgi:Domain of unknown function (DUF6398)